MHKIYKNINNYYTKKIKAHGATPKGVDWNGEESQFVRFEQLSKIINKDNFSINDIGCGYGKYLEFLSQNFEKYTYHGYDLSEEMIRSAKNNYPHGNFSVIENLESIVTQDYSITSGIFNVKMQHNEAEWLSYILDT